MAKNSILITKLDFWVKNNKNVLFIGKKGVGKTAMVRELHVYGQVNSVGTHLNSGAQHRGIGKQLMKAAETLAIKNSYEKNYNRGYRINN